MTLLEILLLVALVITIAAAIYLLRRSQTAPATVVEPEPAGPSEEEQAKIAAAAAEAQALAEQLAEERRSLRKLRDQLQNREDRLEAREARLESERSDLEQQRGQTRSEQQALLTREQQITLGELAISEELHRVAGLTSDEAKEQVLAQTEHEARLEASTLARSIETTAKREAEARARSVLATAIQRLAAVQTAESVVTALELPSDEMKGRIIGREGRNIRSFEQITGVNVMIDDTPEMVLLSAFDPVRRETARLTLEELIADGRIHPARIEEVHARSLQRIEAKTLEAAEEALREVGISNLHPDLKPILGSLTYRTSYGQNVLAHLIECAHLADMMARELGLDPVIAKRGAFLHDIGKALTHQVEGTHALVGADLARKFGEDEAVVHCIEAHHNEVEPVTVEALLTQAADAISGSRPGARRESLEHYVQRLEKLEELASAHEGVDRVFAMQAGREIRVMVLPEVVDDSGAHALARSIAREIETSMTYPGEVRVTVVRESRATETAH